MRARRERGAGSSYMAPAGPLARVLLCPDLPEGEDSLREAVEGRWIWIKRDPVLHRWGLLRVRVRLLSAEEAGDNSRDSLIQQIANMGFTERLKAAMKGSREMRAILIRDPNKMVAASVLSSPKLSDAEIEGFARMTNIAEEVLRIMGMRRLFDAVYTIEDARFRGKPAAHGFHMLLRKHHLDPHRCAFVDDALENLRAAHRLGMSTVWVSRERRRLPFVDLRVRTVRELPRLVFRTGSA